MGGMVDTVTAGASADVDIVPDDYGMSADLRLVAMSGQLHHATSQLSEPAQPNPPTLKRGRGRPRGRNFTRVSVFLDDKTIAEYDAIAAEGNISRSEAIRQRLLTSR